MDNNTTAIVRWKSTETSISGHKKLILPSTLGCTLACQAALALTRLATCHVRQIGCAHASAVGSAAPAPDLWQPRPRGRVGAARSRVATGAKAGSTRRDSPPHASGQHARAANLDWAPWPSSRPPVPSTGLLARAAEAGAATLGPRHPSQGARPSRAVVAEGRAGRGPHA